MSEPTLRERLLARVLSDPHTAGHALVLSAREEPHGKAEDYARRLVAARVDPSGLWYYPRAANTHAELVQVLPNEAEDDLTLVTSAYHQLRAFLTAVAVMPRPWRLKVWNAPAPSGMDQLGDEFSKIAAYQQTGDVASFQDGMAYLYWRDGQ